MDTFGSVVMEARHFGYQGLHKASLVPPDLGAAGT
jgi:hypothetical protein